MGDRRRSGDERAEKDSGGVVSGDHALAFARHWIDFGLRAAGGVSGIAAVARSVGFVEADRSVVKSAALRGRDANGSSRRSAASAVCTAYLASVSGIQHR